MDPGAEEESRVVSTTDNTGEYQGCGAKRIIDACHAQNVEEPTWSDNGGFITVTFKRPVYKASNTGDATIRPET